MFSRNIARVSQRAAPIRSAAQRRFNSAEAQPSWVADNEFNRERAAVKHHAAATSGASSRSAARPMVLRVLLTLRSDFC